MRHSAAVRLPRDAVTGELTRGTGGPVQPQPRPEPGQHRRRWTASPPRSRRPSATAAPCWSPAAPDAAPPLGFHATDDKTLIGSEPDLAYLVADVLGLKLELSAADWENSSSASTAGKVDAVISNVTVTEERKEKYDFATYRHDNLAFETQKDTGLDGQRPQGPGRQDHRRRLRHQPGEDPARLERRERRPRALAADRHQVLPERHRLLPRPVLRPDRRLLRPEPDRPYHVASAGADKGHRHLLRRRRRLQGQIAATTKKDNGLVKAFADAINHIIENGTYQQVLDRWNLASEA